MSLVQENCFVNLTVDKLNDICTDIDLDDLDPNSNLWKPKGGCVYVFPLTQFHGRCSEDWRADGYRWRQNGTVSVPSKKPLYSKIHFVLQKRSSNCLLFRKFVYKPLFKPQADEIVIVHYMGDEGESEDFPHGNCKKTNSNYFPSAPSLKAVLRRKSTDVEGLKVQDISDSVQYKPRNKNQLAYYQKVSCRVNKMSIDTLLDIQELACEIKDFVWSFVTYPEAFVTCGLLDIVKFVQKLCNHNVPYFSYDTNITVGHVHISCLTFRASSLDLKPCIPVAFALYEVPSHSVHETLFTNLLDHLKFLDKAVVITDGEELVEAAIKSACVNWEVVGSWSGITRDVELWARKNLNSEELTSEYTDMISDLLQCTDTQYQLKLDVLQAAWSETFLQYYYEHLERRVLHAYSHYLDSCGIVEECVTANTSAQMNAVIKRLQDSSEPRQDLTLRSLHKLQILYTSELKRILDSRGKCNVNACGEAKLLQYSNANDIEKLLFEVRMAFEDCDFSKDKLAKAGAATSAHMTVSHVPDQKAFLVGLPDGDLHGVRVFPKERCSCRTGRRCAHICAVLRSLGITPSGRKNN